MTVHASMAQRRVLEFEGGAARSLAILTVAALIALGAMARITTPLSPVPITAQTLVVCLAGALLGARGGALAAAVYAGAGLAGLPVLAVASGGLTFGYQIGFVAAAAVVGCLFERGAGTSLVRAAGAMALGSILILGLGAAGLGVVLGASPAEAIDLGVLPFLPGDAIKIALGAAILRSFGFIAARRG